MGRQRVGIFLGYSELFWLMLLFTYYFHYIKCKNKLHIATKKLSI